MTTGATSFQHLFHRGSAEAPPLLLLPAGHAETTADRNFAAGWRARMS
jgi:hypothetical protein